MYSSSEAHYAKLDSSVDLFDDPELDLETHKENDDGIKDSQSAKGIRTCDGQKGKTEKSVFGEAHVNQSSERSHVLEDMSAVGHSAKGCTNDNSSLVPFEELNETARISEEDAMEGLPFKKQKQSELNRFGNRSHENDVNFMTYGDCAGVLFSKCSSAEAGNMRLAGASAENKKDSAYNSDIPTYQEAKTSGDTDHCENCDSRDDVEMKPIEFDSTKNGVDHKSLQAYQDKMSLQNARDRGEPCDEGRKWHTFVSQDQSSLSPTVSEVTCEISGSWPSHVKTRVKASGPVNNNNSEGAMLECNSDQSINHEGDPFQFVCPLCDYDMGDMLTLDVHMQTVHMELREEVPEMEVCPLCGMTSSSEADIKLHIKSHSADTIYGISQAGKEAVFSVQSVPQMMEPCPVCELEMTDVDLMNSHIESHFNPQHRMEPNRESCTDLAVDEQAKENLSATSSGNVEKNHVSNYKEIQAQTSQYKSSSPSTSQERLTPSNSNDSLSNKRQHEKTQKQGKEKMSPADMKIVDNGSTRTPGLIEKIEYMFRTQARQGQEVLMCSETDHYGGSYGDKGWGCGYRNFQMLVSCLSRNPDYAEKLFPGGSAYIPSILKIQQLIELAWKDGFDPQGCIQLRGQVLNTRKWIGATEIVTVLSFLGIKCRLADFSAPSAADGTHPHLLQWVDEYFSTQQPCFIPPLYLQHQGHSRTIVGVEREHGAIKLLLFDPGTPRNEIAAASRGQLNWKHMRTFRLTQAALRARQYQIVAVVGFLTDAEYEESKILKSEHVS